MDSTKTLLQSKTFIGIIITLISSFGPAIASFFGYTVTSEDTAAIVKVISSTGELVGLALATYGRVKATKTITK